MLGLFSYRLSKIFFLDWVIIVAYSSLMMRGFTTIAYCWPMLTLFSYL